MAGKNEFLFEQMPAMQYGTDIPRLSFSVNDSMLYPMGNITHDEMEEHWGINNIDDREHSTVKIVFGTGNADASLDDELMKLGYMDPTEPFTITRFMGPGVFFQGLAWGIDCAKPNCTTFDIRVVKSSDGTVVQEVLDVSASNGSAFNGDMLAKPEFIASGEVFLLQLVFKTLPYKNAAGELSWGNSCNPPPCMNFRVHALVEDSCLAKYITGCGVTKNCCNNPVPTAKCDTPTLAKSC
ncbi:MAG: hypothetical protein BWK73_20135 [Thiothrix lacustris]|uniref:Uncharacterized protein n=1 Tax=Thiothrix lacustris TaxID=525917 RepID=A0A1Y1QP52_9GAMM|nr:MAG: hypothetical protein BWK73_20135 [Thiothrix lacustris]